MAGSREDSRGREWDQGDAGKLSGVLNGGEGGRWAGDPVAAASAHFRQVGRLKKSR